MTTKSPPPLIPAPKRTVSPVPESRASVVSRTIPEAKVQWLGRLGDHDYGLIAGVEYAVEVRRSIGFDAYSRQDGELAIAKVVSELLGGDRFDSTQHHRAFPMPAGTFERLSAEAAEKQARAEAARVPKPIDLLARLRPLQGTPDTFLQAPDRGIDSDIWAPAAVRAGGFAPVRGAFLPGSPAVRGPGAIVDALRAKGVDLSLTDGGRLLVKARNGRLDDDTLAVCRAAERLLVAELSGVALLCELQHEGKSPEAETMVAVGIAACAAHAAGEAR